MTTTYATLAALTGTRNGTGARGRRSGATRALWPLSDR